MWMDIQGRTPPREGRAGAKALRWELPGGASWLEPTEREREREEVTDQIVQGLMINKKALAFTLSKRGTMESSA